MLSSATINGQVTKIFFLQIRKFFHKSEEKNPKIVRKYLNFLGQDNTLMRCLTGLKSIRMSILISKVLTDWLTDKITYWAVLDS